MPLGRLARALMSDADDDATAGTRASELRAETKLMRTHLDRLEREVHHEEEGGDDHAIEKEPELPDTTDMVLTHSFSHESAYYSICDPAQRSKAYAVLLCVITILYFVMLPGVVPLVADDRDENHKAGAHVGWRPLLDA